MLNKNLPPVPSPGVTSATKLADMKVNYYRIEGDIQYLTGRILTVIDASFPDGKQQKAVKDLIKSEFRNLLGQYQSYSNEGHSLEWLS